MEDQDVKIHPLRATIDRVRRDILSQMKRQNLLEALEVIFKDVQFPDDVYVYCYRRYDGKLHVEFSPNGDDKDFQPFVHRICQRFGCKFIRTSYEATVSYNTEFRVSGEEIELQVTGTVPGSCHVEEHEEEIPEDEYQENLKRAQDSVKRTKTVRKIVCHDDPPSAVREDS